MFQFISFGESHSAAIGGVIEECPSGVVLNQDLIRQELQRRRGPRHEAEEVEWLSGMLEGETLGTPLAFIIRNTDARSQDYEHLKDCYRPGHADYTYQQRYGIRDWRGGGRSSARITAAHVVAGAIAKQLLASHGIAITTTICEEPPNVPNDTHGGILSCTIVGVPAGVGNPTPQRLDALLSAAMFTIPSVIGFEIGAGFAAAHMQGSEYIDHWNSDFTTQTNHCGGIQGGISNGMPIQFRVAFHPIVSLPQGVTCITSQGNLVEETIGGRHDRCQIHRAGVIVEAQAALTLAQLML